MDYEPVDMAAIAAEANRVTEPAANNNNNEDFLAKFVKIPAQDGYVVMRILPRKRGKNIYCATRTHRLIDPFDPEKSRSVHCPRELVKSFKNGKEIETWRDVGDNKCIVCKYYSDLWAKSETLNGKAQVDLQNKARSIKPVERYYYNVIVRQQKNKDGVMETNVGPLIFSCGKTVHARIMRAFTGDALAGEDSLGDITNPVTGRDFRLVKKLVKGANGAEYPSYDNSKFTDPLPLGDNDDVEAWLAAMHDLQALRVLKDEENMKQQLKWHLGLVQEETRSSPSLLDSDEFRKPSERQPDAEIREELVTKAPQTTTAVVEEEDPMVDEDFMKVLDDL